MISNSVLKASMSSVMSRRSFRLLAVVTVNGSGGFTVMQLSSSEIKELTLKIMLKRYL